VIGASAAADPEAVRAEISAMLTSGRRLPLPIEKIRPALTAHYLRNNGSIYWVGTGRMNALLQRMGAAGYDGLNPADYPADALAQLRDNLGSDDAAAAAQAELYYSAFFLAYAADLKIGRVTPQKVDPNLFRTH
jgi:L,D-transpeptidase YcbB